MGEEQKESQKISFCEIHVTERSSALTLQDCCHTPSTKQQQQQQQQHQQNMPTWQQQTRHQHQLHNPALQSQQSQHQQHPQYQQRQQRNHQQQRVQKQLVRHPKLWKQRYDRNVLKPSLLSLESLSVSLESLFYEQTGVDSKFNNSSTATGTMQSTSSTISTSTSGATGFGEEKQQVNCLQSIDNTLIGEKKVRYKISCSFKSLDNNCKSLFNFLRGKGTTNGIAPAKSIPTSEDCKEDTPSRSVNTVVAHHQPQHHGFRMLLNRKLFNDRRDSVLLAPNVNVAES
ncbi:signal transducer and activator of transcription C-like [Anopheles funestus]|uniref:signal transducer and activator of transcription C-like n=1 Tax=Anopheles funestus TaxID=62324 RepID=UPI0020C60A26|nr:signal transducer and activator of transcription C-like [Anopheles funestus]